MSDAERTAKIAALNDDLRIRGIGGHVVFAGVLAQASPLIQFIIWREVKNFNAFTEDNNPYGERDFVSVQIDGETFFGKIDYYDLNLEYGSPDPADPTVTARVLTIFHASDY